MAVPTREALLVETFVRLADSLVVGFDVVELLQTLVEECTELFDAAGAGILLVTAERGIQVMVSTSERSERIGVLQLRAGQGPCIEAIASGTVVSVVDLRDAADRWPRFAREARQSGFRSIHAIPLRLRDTTVGSLNLFRTQPGPLGPEDATAAQALADVATISILQERLVRESHIARDQLQRALDSRVVIEQAKGYLSHTLGIDMDAAFERIRQHARSRHERLGAVAARIVTGALTLEA